jgi:hypothetical protein
MIAHRPKTLFQVIIGRWQIWHVIAMKEAWGKAVGRLDHMINDLNLPEVKLWFVCLQIGEPVLQASTDLSGREVLSIG